MGRDGPGFRACLELQRTIRNPETKTHALAACHPPLSPCCASEKRYLDRLIATFSYLRFFDLVCGRPGVLREGPEGPGNAHGGPWATSRGPLDPQGARAYLLQGRLSGPDTTPHPPQCLKTGRSGNGYVWISNQRPKIISNRFKPGRKPLKNCSSRLKLYRALRPM